MKSYTNSSLRSNSLLLENIEAVCDSPEEEVKKGHPVAEGADCHILMPNGMWRPGKRIVCHNVNQTDSVCVEGSCGLISTR